jgi:hypothetical protein
LESETGVVRAFAFFGGDQLCLLLHRRELHLHVALLPLRAGLARNTGHGNAGRSMGRGCCGSLLGRRRRKRRIAQCSGGRRRLLLLLTFGLKRVFNSRILLSVLSCKAGCGGCPFALACCAGVFLPDELKSAATITSHAAPR